MFQQLLKSCKSHSCEILMAVLNRLFLGTSQVTHDHHLLNLRQLQRLEVAVLVIRMARKRVLDFLHRFLGSWQ